LNVSRAADSGGSDSAVPWRWRISERTLWVIPRSQCRVLSWAPLGGGIRVASLIANHQVRIDDADAARAPRTYLARCIRGAGYEPRRAVVMMTGANVARAGYAAVKRAGFVVGAWCTAGFSNALRVADRATVMPGQYDGVGRPGTINLIVMANRPMAPEALAEAVQIATEARTLAVLDAGVKSVRSGLPATGTGTDCITIAAPIAGDVHSAWRASEERYCGKHTLLGELIGRAVMQSCGRAFRQVR
jgi:adenosylcobinamide amidohydrolase